MSTLRQVLTSLPEYAGLNDGARTWAPENLLEEQLDEAELSRTYAWDGVDLCPVGEDGFLRDARFRIDEPVAVYVGVDEPDPGNTREWYTVFGDGEYALTRDDRIIDVDGAPYAAPGEYDPGGVRRAVTA